MKGILYLRLRTRQADVFHGVITLLECKVTEKPARQAIEGLGECKQMTG